MTIVHESMPPTSLTAHRGLALPEDPPEDRADELRTDDAHRGSEVTRGSDRWSRLAVRVSQGDDTAFEPLVVHLEGRLHRYFRLSLSKLGRADLATTEELTQRAAVELWKTLTGRGYDPSRASIVTLAYAIARNVWLRFLRDGRRAGRFRSAENEEEPSVPDDTEALLVEVESLDALRHCVESLRRSGSLSELDHAVLDGLLEGATEREIAAGAGAPSSTVHDRKKGLLRRLRACLESGGKSSGHAERGGEEPMP